MQTVTKEFQAPQKSFWKSVGPAIILIGLGIGSGEFILWPYLSVNYGYGLLWGALIGITLQLFLILEIQRYTVVSGENIIKGFSRIWKYLPIWVIFSTLIGFGWPGFSAISAKLIIGGFSLPEQYFLPIAIFILILSASVLLLGKNVYKKVLFSQKINISVLFIFVFFLFIYYFDLKEFSNVLKGFVGIGENYYFYPAGLGIGVFLSALAYAGSGGNLLLGNSFYSIEEGEGLAKQSSKFLLWQKKGEKKELKKGNETIKIIASESEKSIFNFKKLRKRQIFKNVLVFWGLGMLTIVLLSYVSKVTLSGVEIKNDFSFLITEANIFSTDIGVWAGVFFLILGIYNLATIQMGILDFSGRSTAMSLKAVFLNKKLDHNKIYIYAVLIQVLFGVMVFSFGFTEPKSLIILGAIINAVVMGFMAIFLIILNKKFLPKSYQINKLSLIVLSLASFIYFSLFIYTVVEKIIG
ncbi:MAG: Nramp family divalent metal transporter [Candidatus Pacebacteria bacterium]|nr:Nramp family divalent metal transporter [Candidatus Paceibacterota bacterium]